MVFNDFVMHKNDTIKQILLSGVIKLGPFLYGDLKVINLAQMTATL